MTNERRNVEKKLFNTFSSGRDFLPMILSLDKPAERATHSNVTEKRFYIRYASQDWQETSQRNKLTQELSVLPNIALWMQLQASKLGECLYIRGVV